MINQEEKNINRPKVKSDLQLAIIEFRSLYWEPMAIVEKNDVENAMVNFNDGIKANIPADNLQLLALYLSHICKNEVNSEFNTDGEESRYGNNESLLRKMDKILGN